MIAVRICAKKTSRAKSSVFVPHPTRMYRNDKDDGGQIEWKLRAEREPYAFLHMGRQGRTQRGFEGVHQIQLGVWGRCESPPPPPAGFRGSAPEDFQIDAFRG